jgi:dihydroanticapsin dehydrogenase
MGRLDGRIAIVTGGASGIGEGIVKTLAAEGAMVVSADIQEDLGQQVVDSVKEAGGSAEYFNADLRELDQIQALVDHVVTTHGRIDALVPNAGLQYEKILTDTSEEEYDHMMNVNMKGTFFLCKYGVEAMLKTGGGSIVATGSVLSLVAEQSLAAYCATKAGILNLIKSIATDYGRQNIRANCVCPGYINTPLGDRYFDSLPRSRGRAQGGGRTPRARAHGRAGGSCRVRRFPRQRRSLLRHRLRQGRGWRTHGDNLSYVKTNPERSNDPSAAMISATRNGDDHIKLCPSIRKSTRLPLHRFGNQSKKRFPFRAQCR